MKPKKPKTFHTPRKVTIPFEKHANDAPGMVDGKFVAQVGQRVWVWRHRAGNRPSWYPCKVMKVDDKAIELWDEGAEQWYGFDPTAPNAPEVRLFT